MTEIDETGAVDDASTPDEEAAAPEDGSLTDVTSEAVGEETPRIIVRSTVHLPGLPLGAIVPVDPSNPQIKRYLEGEFLVPVESGDGN